jgi:multidrug efflux pump subunit AcrA (membrane-fusion protein)
MPYFDYHGEKFATLNGIEPPRVSVVIGWALVLTMVTIALFLTFVPWVQTAYGVGKVTALNPYDRQQEINALVPGRIQEWYVRDGSSVKVGDPILRI